MAMNRVSDGVHSMRVNGDDGGGSGGDGGGDSGGDGGGGSGGDGGGGCSGEPCKSSSTH